MSPKLKLVYKSYTCIEAPVVSTERNSNAESFPRQNQHALMFRKYIRRLNFPFIFGGWSQQIRCRCSGVPRIYATPVQTVIRTIFKFVFFFRIFRGWIIRECFKDKLVHLFWAGRSIGILCNFFGFWVISIQVSVFVVNRELYLRRVPCRSRRVLTSFVLFLCFNISVDVAQSFLFFQQLILQSETGWMRFNVGQWVWNITAQGA